MNIHVVDVEIAAEVDIEIVEAPSSFEKQMLEKWEKMNGTVTEISKNVCKLTKHFITSKENTVAKEVVSETSDASAKILKEMAGTLKEILKSKDSASVMQPADVQLSTQILIEWEIEKKKTINDSNLEPKTSKEGCCILASDTQ